MRNANRARSFIEQLESRTMLTVAEPNNTFATAVVLGNSKGFGGTSTVTDTITSTDTIDIFRIFTNAAGTLTVNLKNISAVLKMTLVHDINANGIEDAGEVLVSKNAIAGIGGTISVFKANRLPIESYFVKLQRATLFNTNYSLTVSYDTAGSTLATARSLNSDVIGAFGVHDVSEGVDISDNTDIFSFSFDPRVSSAAFSAQVFAPSTALYHIDIIRDSNNNRVIDAGEFLRTFENSGGPITLTNGATYFLRVVRSQAATENYQLRTQFDYAGITLAQARNINSIDNLLQTFKDQAYDGNGVALNDRGDVYRFTIGSTQDVCFQVILLDQQIPGARLTSRLIRDANNNGAFDVGEELTRVVTGSNGVATLNFALPASGNTVYFLEILPFLSANYSLVIQGDRIPGIIPSNQYSHSSDVGTLTGLAGDSSVLGPSDGVNGDPSDTFKFTLPVAGRLSAKLFNNDTTFITGRLNFDTDKDGIVDSNEQLATFDQTTPLNKDLAAGTYFITVAGQSRQYSLELTPDFAGDLSNPRNMGTLSAFTQVSDHISALDADVYRFGISGTQNFTANGQAGQTNLTFFLALDLGGGANTFLTQAAGTGGFTQLQKSLSAGSYFLVVSGAQDSDYTIGFSTGDNDDSIVEAGLTANHRLVVGDSRDFTISDPSDVDIVLVNLDATGDTAFGVDIDSRNGSNFDTFVRLFDPAGNQLAFNDNGAAPGETLSKFSFLTFVVPANFNSDFVFVAISSAQNRNYNPLTGAGDSGGSSSGQYTVSISKFNPAWIGGSVYNDLDGDGAKDANETRIAGRTVFIDADNDNALDANEMRTTTDAAGQYTFKGLLPGTYKVRQVRPAGWTQTLPLNNFGRNVTITAGQHSTGNNFFIRPTPAGIGRISGNVFHDFNRNGVKDSGDAGLGGFVLYIDTDNDSILDTNEQRVLTDSSGNYVFSNLGSGTYKIRMVRMSGFVQTLPASNLGNNAMLATSSTIVSGKNFGADN